MRSSDIWRETDLFQHADRPVNKLLFLVVQKSIDGRIPTSNDTVGQIEEATCSATGGKENNPWWYIDLQQEYMVQEISFYGRISTAEQSQGFYISVGNCPSSTTDIFYDDPVGSSLPSDYQPRTTKLSNAIKTNCVKVEKRPYNQTASLSICELQIYADCPPNQCGWTCEKSCYCNNEITGQMKIDGFCPYGCTGRWTGINGACNTECNDTSWGEVCQKICGNCLDSPCDVFTGECKRGCSGPWVPPLCTKECDRGKYGRNCTERCGKWFQNDICNLETGLCPRGCQSGNRGNRCLETCLPGTYGTNCGEKCGNCVNVTACNSISGRCANGCSQGWRGSRCVTPCSDGHFGTNCERKCGRCKNNQTCDHITGECTNGCHPGFNGLRCDTDSNLLAKIKNEVTVSTSSVYQDWKAERSLDGTFVADPTTCQCCSGTRNDMVSWLKIDLQKQHPIAKVSVYGRVNENVFQQLTGFDLRLQNDSLNSEQPVFANILVSNNTREVTIPNTLARFIEIRRPGKLTICEVQVIEGECSVGRFGVECSKECHCADQKLCDRNDGTCVSAICDIGFHGEACDTECPEHHFGQGCTRKCHCLNGANCSKDYGVCPNNCAPGYEGTHCENECGQGKFGLRCQLECGKCKDDKHCNHVTGNCPDGCKPGYIGSLCKEALNLIEAVKETVHTSMSSTHMNWTSERAIDGEIGPDPVKCQCCSSTKNEQTSWWRVDLGKKYPINRIEVFGRQQENSYQQLQGFKLNLGNDTSEISETVYINTVMDEDHINLTLPNTIAKIIEIERVGKLTICEVNVYEGDCPLGRYGEECREYCHCADKMECDRTQGICESPVCEVGWTGESCNKNLVQIREKFWHQFLLLFPLHQKKNAPHGYYGLHCDTECGMCNSTETCNHETGRCSSSGCADGYHGYLCNERQGNITSAASTNYGIAVSIPLTFAVLVGLGVTVYCINSHQWDRYKWK
ncbi:cell death abnormality protein 1-like [Mercenaria mercenaria]|uniref:cell death abnormality protein 1-like n=1 Tax=Mercenaria mercenaria TaxID=6596 RepID=UPI00234F97BB|nr:cell death abnormality protein 1-like [Mercenaria mercenaria]